MILKGFSLFSLVFRVRLKFSLTICFCSLWFSTIQWEQEEKENKNKHRDKEDFCGNDSMTAWFVCRLRFWSVSYGRWRIDLFGGNLFLEKSQLWLVDWSLYRFAQAVSAKGKVFNEKKELFGYQNLSLLVSCLFFSSGMIKDRAFLLFFMKEMKKLPWILHAFFFVVSHSNALLILLY